MNLMATLGGSSFDSNDKGKEQGNRAVLFYGLIIGTGINGS